MKRLHLLFIASAAALALPLASRAGTATFGLFTNAGCCSSCNGCPGAYNAFAPRCCGYENASGCTAYPFNPQFLAHPGCGSHGCGSHGCGSHGCGWGGCGPQGCGFGGWHGLCRKRFFGLCGHGDGYAYDAPFQAPCGVAAAFHGVAGGLGCGDPYNGCGSKPRLGHRLANWKLKHSRGSCLGCKQWGVGPLGRLKAKLGCHKLGGGHIDSDGVIESSPLIVGDDVVSDSGFVDSEPVEVGQTPAQPSPIRQTGYAPQGYYPPQGYYYYPTPWGYYPAYGYPAGY